MRKRTTALLLAIWFVMALATAQLTVEATAYVLPSCPTEDSVNCVWRSSERGNGAGHSFVNYFGLLNVRVWLS